MSKFKIHNMGIKGHGVVEIFIPSRYNGGQKEIRTAGSLEQKKMQDERFVFDHRVDACIYVNCRVNQGSSI